ncbi:MAG TPA: hypothetical protein VMM60_06820 [Ilumatobacter sp.]|nr:hypothetical protein [Ilumatobacter sp.]
MGDHGTATDGVELRVGPVTVDVHPGLRTSWLRDADGSSVGVFLGHVIDYRNHRVIEDEVQLIEPLAGGHDQALSQIEDFVYGFGGRWVFVISYGGSSRLYLDADGSNSVVFDRAHRRAASTTGLLLDDDDYVARFDAELYDTLRVRRDGWFPSGLTAHFGVERLLCNHYLDLDDWQVRRHWPTEDIHWTDDPRGHARRIAEIARSTVGTLISESRVAASLTAGNETRFLLAAMRPFATEIDFVTNAAPGTELDVHHAEQLSRRFGLRHVVLEPRKASAREMREWQYGASHTVGGNNMWYHPSIAPLGAYDYFVGGLGGEIGRAFFWRQADAEASPLDPRSICARFGMPLHPRVLHATTQWWASVEHMNTLTQLDLAYLELRMSAWAFAQAYAQDRIVDHIHPLISRETFQLMLELDPETKRNNGFVLEGIGMLWPELLELPINKYGDYRDVVTLARKVIKPSRVVRRIRRRLG